MSYQPHSSDAQDYYEERRLSRRITALQILFAAVFVVYLMTFWYHQVVRTDHYRRLSDNNRLRRVTAMPSRSSQIESIVHGVRRPGSLQGGPLSTSIHWGNP